MLTKSKLLNAALWTTLASISLPLVSLVKPAKAAESTFGVCETRRDTIRAYSQNGQPKIRAYDRVNNVTWLDASANRTTNPEVVEYRNLRGEQTVIVGFNRNGPTDCYIIIGGRTANGQVVGGNPGDGTANVPPAVAERACLNRAQQMGYRIFDQTAAQPDSTGYTMSMKGILNGQQIPLRCTYTSSTGIVVVDRVSTPGFPGRTFNGIPNYGTVRVLANGYNDVPGQNRRYFRVELPNGSTTTWYANCRTRDQIYDSRSIYLGYSPNARVMLSYVCSFSSTVPPRQPR